VGFNEQVVIVFSHTPSIHQHGATSTEQAIPAKSDQKPHLDNSD